VEYFSISLAVEYTVFSIVPLSEEVLTMVYTKGKIDTEIVEFDISTKKYKPVTAFERTDNMEVFDQSRTTDRPENCSRIEGIWSQHVKLEI